MYVSWDMSCQTHLEYKTKMFMGLLVTNRNDRIYQITA